MSVAKPLRAGLFVDGFNLYHAIDDLGARHLKWLNLRKLGQIIIPKKSEELVEVVYCSAYYPGDQDKHRRHDHYIRALMSVQVTIHLGHYVREPMSCRSCGHEWKKPTEKQTDINLALSVIDAVRQNRVDCVYLLTADTDQAATWNYVTTHFPNIKRINVFPPERHPSDDLRNRSHGSIRLNRGHIENALFDGLIEGTSAILRPKEYDPP